MSIRRSQIYFVNLNIPQDYPTNVRVSPDESGLPIETVSLCFQMRSLDKKRFQDRPIGQLSSEKMQEIEAAVRYCMGL